MTDLSVCCEAVEETAGEFRDETLPAGPAV
jgi:hypothetical protein